MKLKDKKVAEKKKEKTIEKVSKNVVEKTKEKPTDKAEKNLIEKTEEKIVEKAEKKSPKKKKVVIGICSMLFVVVSIIVGILLLSKNNKDDSYKIAKQIANELKNEYSNLTLVEEKEDAIDKYSFLSVTSIYIDSIGSVESQEYAVSVAKYNSNVEALGKKQFYDDYNKFLHEKFDNTAVELIGNYDSVFMKNEILVIGKYLFSINPKVKNIDELKKSIEKIIQKFNTNDIGTVDENELNKYWNDRLNNFKIQYEEEYNRLIEEIKQIFREEIDNVKNCSTITSCNKIIEQYQDYSKYEELSEEINKLNEEYKSRLITVVDFSSMSKQNFENWCNENGLVCSIKEEYSDTISKNGFIKQSKEANTEVLKGDSITLTYSLGRKPTQSELNALNKAQSYSDRQYMSKSRLYHQLTSQYGEGFTAEEAQYAIDHVKADWNYNALQKGKSYYTRQNMSKSRVYQQLVSSYGEGFTAEEAQYAIDHLDD